MIDINTALTGKDLENAIDQDIGAFNTWFVNTLKNEALTPSERAIIKTFMWWKVAVNGAKEKV